MLQHAQIDEQLLDEYLESGNLLGSLVVQIFIIKTTLEYRAVHLSEKEQKVYDMVLSDCNTIQTMLDEINGQPKEHCPYEEEVEGKNGYKFKHCDYIGVHLISITKDNFFWTIGVNADGNFWKLGNDVRILNYNHNATNGSLNDIINALECTKQFFPKRHFFHRYEMRYSHQNDFDFQSFCSEILSITNSSGKKVEDCFIIMWDNLFNPQEQLDKLIITLKNIYPQTTAEIKPYENTFGLKILHSEIPAFLTAKDMPAKEARAANKFSDKEQAISTALFDTPLPLKWLAAKSFWSTPEGKSENMETIPEDMKPMVTKAKKFCR